MRRRTRALLPLVAVGLLFATACEGPGPLVATAPVVNGGRLVWSEEFTGPAGSLPQASHWNLEVGTDWGNAQLEYDTNRASNVSLDGQGHLAITARREAFQGSAYTSGRISTRGWFAQRYGRFEARMKLPSGRGMWPAFWMLGDDIGTVPWPGCGEIDVMEYRGQEPTVIHGSLHGPGYSGGNARTRSFVLPGGARFDDGFHVFAIEWTANQVRYLVDGVAYQVLTPASLPSGTRWVFDHPFFILLNLAVGGNYVGPPDATTVFPQTLLVDYVRVYQAGS